MFLWTEEKCAFLIYLIGKFGDNEHIFFKIACEYILVFEDYRTQNVANIAKRTRRKYLNIVKDESAFKYFTELSKNQDIIDKFVKIDQNSNEEDSHLM